MHVFVTGHTGFKGAWLTLMLTESGHTVSGLSLDPEPGCLFERAMLQERVAHDFRSDIRNPAATARALAMAAPDVVVHMAAQPLVRESYSDPRRTFETNVNGTLNVLEAVSHTESVKAHLVVTTDKVYRNTGRIDGYAEHDALGGDDPYSASKAMADLLVHSWTRSFPGPTTAVARAGNVIGGGDVSKDRLMPDLLQAFRQGRPAIVRNPFAVRPWQHVLDCLAGYLLLVDQMIVGNASGPWNFGPPPGSVTTVDDVCQRVARIWGDGALVAIDDSPQPHEAEILTLDSARSRQELGWTERLSLDEGLRWTVEWDKAVMAGRPAADECIEQIRAYRRE